MLPPLLLYWRTVRHLTLRQVVYQVWNRLRGRPRLRWAEAVPDTVPQVQFPVTFTLLNQPVTFADTIDWNYADNGKLWTYCLNYFEDLTPPQSLALIYDFIRQTPTLRDGLEPYPISLRVLNWRAFMLDNDIHDPLIERHLYAQTALLRSRLEYHLGGNHLLENACALTVMAVHFAERSWFIKGSQLLEEQLIEQILTDGGHYERSPVYHQLLTDRLLDVYAVLHADTWADHLTLTDLLRYKLGLMLGWLRAVTFRNGEVPMVNDSAYGVAPNTATLLQKAQAMGLVPTPVALGESGYRMLTTPRLECLVDVGPVGPDHQPGHAHADTFSFILHVDSQPVIVDPGTSTYQIGERRAWERSTAAHNTVTIGGQNSSDVWSGFRVGSRAKVTLLADEKIRLNASHDGYNYLNEQHTRSIEIVNDNTIKIKDDFLNKSLIKTCHFHLNPSLHLVEEGLVVQAGKVLIRCQSDDESRLTVTPYTFSAGFNQLAPAQQLTFDSASTTVTTYLTAT
ncbi:alginate lyase family protein [Fibrella aquatilis]|uniref:Alginate lyase family protein n=1 Tax=Fibrella aquatilis TaxID=2817059 RepID=A0A939GB15_9BACT|nr:alginate lyase family protein [Fibrella aquatilis]MBO0933570.1 alginate lyase family protein [Fibrella aquatilis]